MSFYDLPFFPTGSYVENGKDGVSPTVSVKDISGGYSITITDVTGTRTINILNGKEGPQGIQGERGLTGEQGPKGDQGSAGKDGSNGKSAYEIAQAGGYLGTEEEFATLLANSVNKQNITLGLHTDGLLYIFINGEPIGTGVAPSANTGG